jgi:hypothetical protein
MHSKYATYLTFLSCCFNYTLLDYLVIYLFQEYSVTFSSYFNVLWQEPRLHISERFLAELNATSPDTMIPVNLELVNELWLPNIFIYNLKTFKVVEVLSKHAGLWITTNNDVFYSQATHITFICPMRFDAFPLDTQVTLFCLKMYCALLSTWANNNNNDVPVFFVRTELG